MTRIRGFAVLALAPALALTPLAATAATRTVPGDYITIEAAINASADGDIIEVGPGTYVGRYDFGGRDITLRSTDGPAVTILEGSAGTGVFEFENQETAAAVIQGFTIRLGVDTAPSAISISGASPTIIDNVFDSNSRFVGTWGVAIRGNGASPVVARNRFTNFRCDTQHLSGVLTFVNGSQPRIVNNVLDDNPCAAINITMPTGYAPVIVNNTITRNRVGVHVDSRIDAGAQVFRNNILYKNDIGLEVVFANSPADYPTWERNLVFGNSTDYSGADSQTGLNGNLSVDPGLSGLTAGDYHLDQGSPAIDAGLAAAVLPGETDYYRGTRTLDGGVDLGAAEYTGVPPTVTLNVSANEIVIGDSVELTWSATNADGCVAEAAWEGARALSGAEVVTPSTFGEVEYAIRCTNGVAERRAEVTVVVHGPPQIDIAFAFPEVPYGTGVTLGWTTFDADTCEASDAWTGAQPTSGSLFLYPDPGTHTYTLTCTGIGGTASASAQVTVLPPPGLDFTATPQAIAIGGTTTLEWASEGADSCYGYGAWPEGERALSGSVEVTLDAAGDHVFFLYCSGEGGTTWVPLTVRVVPPPTIGFAVDPGSMVEGNVATLSWATTDATACVASGEWSGNKAPGGTTVVSPSGAGTHTYLLTCTGIGGESTASVTLTITTGPTLAFSLSAIAMLEGDSAMLAWEATDATSCMASGAWSGAQGLSGSLEVSPGEGTHVYTLSCTDANAAVAASSVTLTVLARPSSDDGWAGPVAPHTLLALLALLLLRSRRGPALRT